MNKRLDELKSKLWMTNRLSETEDGYIKIIQPAKQRERNFLNGNSSKQLWVNTKRSNTCRQADLRDTAGLASHPLQDSESHEFSGFPVFMKVMFTHAVVCKSVQ